MRGCTAFAKHWGFGLMPVPLSGAYQGKDERGVAYVKRNAIAGRALWRAGRPLEAHLTVGA